MVKKSNIILFTIFILLIGTVFGATNDFSTEYEAIDNIIFTNETATFELEISNDMEIAADFLIYPGDDVEWDVTTEPSESKQVNIGPKKSKTVYLNVRPSSLGNPFPNLYGVSVKVKNLQTREVISSELLVEIKGDATEFVGEYLPAVKANVKVDKTIDPREGIPITVNLINQNRLNISKITVKVTSKTIKENNIKEAEKKGLEPSNFIEYETNLIGLESKNLELLYRLDPLTNPTEDIIDVYIIVPTDNKEFQFRAQSEEFNIISYGKVSTTTNIIKKILLNYEDIEFKNIGNIERNFEYKIKKPLLNFLFMSTYPKPDIQKINETEYYTWQGPLEKTETFSIRITKNYRYIFGFVLLIAIIAILYFVLRSPVIVSKSAVVIGNAEGGISNLRIQIHIKNRSNKPIYNLEVKDKVPNLLKVEQDFVVGTLQPSKILRHENRGTIVKWELDEFDGFEERIISYKVQAKLSILGQFGLPKAVVKYKKHRIGKRYYSHSNNFRMD